MPNDQAGKWHFDKLLLVQYLEKLKDYRLWLEKSEELLDAAEEIEPRLLRSWEIMHQNIKEDRYSSEGGEPHPVPRDLQSVYFMLVAFALENIFKAVYVWQHHHVLSRFSWKKGGRLPSAINEHDLIKLADRINFVLDISDEELLYRLTYNSKWAGRYPVPTTQSGLKNIQVLSDGNAYLTAVFYPHDVVRLKRIISRVKSYADNIIIT